MKKSCNDELLDGELSPFAVSKIRLDPETLKPITDELSRLAKEGKEQGRIPAVRVLAGGGDYLIVRRRDIKEKRFDLFDCFASHVFLLRMIGLVKNGRG